MSDSVQPHRRQPTRLPRPWHSPGKNTGVGCHFLLQCMKVKSESEVISRVRLFVTSWTAALQAPPSMGFSRQEYWSGVCKLPKPPASRALCQAKRAPRAAPHESQHTPGLPVHHQLPEFTQTHVHRVSDAIQPSHPLSSPSPPAPNPSQHQSLFQ